MWKSVPDVKFGLVFQWSAERAGYAPCPRRYPAQARHGRRSPSTSCWRPPKPAPTSSPTAGRQVRLRGSHPPGRGRLPGRGGGQRGRPARRALPGEAGPEADPQQIPGGPAARVRVESIAMMRACVDNVTLDSRPGHGTVVTLRKRVPRWPTPTLPLVAVPGGSARCTSSSLASGAAFRRRLPSSLVPRPSVQATPRPLRLAREITLAVFSSPPGPLSRRRLPSSLVPRSSVQAKSAALWLAREIDFLGADWGYSSWVAG